IAEPPIPTSIRRVEESARPLARQNIDILERMIDIAEMAVLTSQMRGLGFGAGAIGNLYREISDTDAEAALRAALDQHVKYFDTAPHYGFGLSEKRLGRVLAETGTTRDIV